MTFHRWRSREREVVSGPGAVGALPSLLTALDDEGHSPITEGFLITTPRGHAQVQALPPAVQAALPQAFSGAASHSPAPVIREATEKAKQVRARALVAFGGGSALGVAKGVALQTGLPLVAVPTTYAGSAFTSIWGWTEGGIKRTGRDPRVVPRIVIQDPELLGDLPEFVQIRSGLNAMAHGIEALYAPGVNAVVALQAEGGVAALARALPILKQTRADVASPEWISAVVQAQHGAHLCGMALDQATMGLHHQLAHVLGGGWNLPHAALHALLLPKVVAFNAPAAPQAMAALLRALGEPPTADASSALGRLVATLGVNETLQDLGVPDTALPEVIRRILEAPYPNPRPLEASGLRSLLEAAMGGPGLADVMGDEGPTR